MSSKINTNGNQPLQSAAEQEQASPFDFELLWQQYYPKLLLFARPFFPVKADCEDAVQEILFKVFRSSDQYQSRYSISTWIYRIARNYCIDCSRHNMRAAKLHQECINHYTEADFTFSPEKTLLDAEIKAKIRELIRGLEETDQQLCYLYHYADMSYREIHAVLQIPVGTIKYRMHRIRGILKTKMEGYYAGTDA